MEQEQNQKQVAGAGEGAETGAEEQVEYQGARAITGALPRALGGSRRRIKSAITSTSKMEMGTKAGAEAVTGLGARARCVPRTGAVPNNRFRLRSRSSRRRAVLREEINLKLTLVISIDTIKYDCMVIVWE